MVYSESRYQMADNSIKQPGVIDLRKQVIKHMDTDDLTNKTYKATLGRAEKFHPGLMPICVMIK
jgi:hypothetical protein